MKFSKVLIYFIILCALGVWVYFFEIRHKGEKQAKEEKESQLATIDKDVVNEIEIKKDDGGIIRLKKLEDRWVLVEPIKASADQSIVSSVIMSAQLAKAERILQDRDVKWGEYGLDNAAFHITLTSKDSPAQIFIGEMNPSKTSHYIRVGDDPRLFLCADTLKKALDKTVFDLRDKSVVSVAPSDVERIVVMNDGKETEIVRRDNDKWSMIKPEEMRLKSSVVNKDLISLTNLRAKKIIDEPNLEDEQYGLKVPLTTIEVSGPKAGQTLLVGKSLSERSSGADESDIYVAVKDRNNVYVVDGKQLKALSQPDPAALRDKSLFSFNIPDVERLQLELDGKKWVAVRKDDKNWSLEEPEKISQVDTWSITSILWELKDLEWKNLLKGQLPDTTGDGDKKLVASLALKGTPDPLVLTVRWQETPPASEKSEAEKVAEPPAASKREEDSAASSEPEQGASASPKKPVVPELVNAVVVPHEDKGVVFQIPGGFVTRLRNDVGRILSAK